jgi:hypothetical protein
MSTADSWSSEEGRKQGKPRLASAPREKMTPDEYAEQKRQWREAMERAGADVVRMRRANRMVVTDTVPPPDPHFVDKWLTEKDRAARHRAAWAYGIMLAIAAISMIAACIAAWPVIEKWVCEFGPTLWCERPPSAPL